MSVTGTCVKNQISFIEQRKSFIVKEQIKSSSNTSLIEGISVEIPWCSKYITWQVLLNYDLPNVPPDFIFDDPLFDPLITVSAQSKDLCHRLLHWKLEDASSLSDILECLIKSYRQYKKEEVLALNNKVLNFQIDTLPANVDYDIAYYPQYEKVCFCFDIRSVDFSQLAQCGIRELSNLKNCIFSVLVTFNVKSLESRKPEVSVVVPNVLDSFNKKFVTCIKIHSKDCLRDILETSTTTMQQAVNNLAEKIASRQVLLSHIERFLGPCLDHKAGITDISSFIVRKGQSVHVLFLKIGPEFPEKSPQFILQGKKGSFTNLETDALYFKTITPANWNSLSMDIREMTYTLINCLKEI